MYSGVCECIRVWVSIDVNEQEERMSKLMSRQQEKSDPEM